jgi:hypothetical protein
VHTSCFFFFWFLFFLLFEVRQEKKLIGNFVGLLFLKTEAIAQVQRTGRSRQASVKFSSELPEKSWELLCIGIPLAETIEQSAQQINLFCFHWQYQTI